MKIEIKEKDRNFFDECLYIQIYIKNVLKKPDKKIWYASKMFIKGMIMYLLCVLLFLMIVVNDGFDPINITFLCISIVCFLIMVYNYFVVKKQINLYMNGNDKSSIFEIDEDGIKLENGTGNIEMKWDSVKHIIINHETVSFLPADAIFTSVIMFISTKYKDEVIDAIKKYNKEELVIDNSNLYN